MLPFVTVILQHISWLIAATRVIARTFCWIYTRGSIPYAALFAHATFNTVAWISEATLVRKLHDIKLKCQFQKCPLRSLQSQSDQSHSLNQQYPLQQDEHWVHGESSNLSKLSKHDTKTIFYSCFHTQKKRITEYSSLSIFEYLHQCCITRDSRP